MKKGPAGTNKSIIIYHDPISMGMIKQWGWGSQFPPVFHRGPEYASKHRGWRCTCVFVPMFYSKKTWGISLKWLELWHPVLHKTYVPYCLVICPELLLMTCNYLQYCNTTDCNGVVCNVCLLHNLLVSCFKNYHRRHDGVDFWVSKFEARGYPGPMVHMKSEDQSPMVQKAKTEAQCWLNQLHPVAVAKIPKVS